MIPLNYLSRRLCLVALLTLTLAPSARADWNIDPETKYYITCNYAPNGFIGLGSEQGSTYDLYYQTKSSVPTADGYWYIAKDGEGYTFRNVMTSQYLSWTETYNQTQCKYLTLVDRVGGDTERWTLTEGNGFVSVRSVAQPSYQWNLRKSTYMMGCYESSTTDTNEQFNILDDMGNPISFSEGEDGGEEDSPYLSHGDEMLYLRGSDSTVLVVPRDYVVDYTYGGSLFEATLVDGESLVEKPVVDVSETLPEDAPGFASFKFNNKYNSQLFADSECETPGEDALTLSVGCIGKWLTASFTLRDEGGKAYVGTVRQRSKKTRQSYAEPVTYRLTKPGWTELRLREDEGVYSRETGDYGREVSVTVDFLTDHPTGQYGVPRVDITLSNTGAWNSSNWISSKTSYQEATITIDGGGVYPDLEATPIQIKGRGNTTWSDSYKSKNPYHFKFDEKHKPLGMKNGKHWILLSNKQYGSMTTNAMGHKIGNLLETAATNHIVPVELYINGSYRGSYDFTERIGFSNNSVDIEDESSAAMIEMDTYADETIYKTNAYGLPAKIHSPDVGEEGVTLTASDIIGDYNLMMASVYTGTDEYLHRVDANYLARYLLACELMDNLELMHPKSAFLYSENVTDGLNAEGDDETPWVFGPMWDCDWGFGYEHSFNYYTEDAELDYYNYIQSFYGDLRYNSTEVDRLTYELMYRFVNEGGLDELKDYCQEYYDYAASAFNHNLSNETSERDGNDYATTTSNSQSWFSTRAAYILSKLTPYDIEEGDSSGDDDEEESSAADHMGDVNDDGTVGVGDLVSTLNHLAGQPNDTFLSARSDLNSDGLTDEEDTQLLEEMIMSQTPSASRNMGMPASDVTLRMAALLTREPDSVTELPFYVCADEGDYSGLQMDLQLPEGVDFYGLSLPSELEDMEVSYALMDGGKYRLLVYAPGNVRLPSETATLELRIGTNEEMSGIVSLTGVSASTSLGEEERVASTGCRLNVCEATGDTTGEDSEEEDGINSPSASGKAGEAEAIYDLSGRRVFDTSRHGIYIMKGKKIMR